MVIRTFVRVIISLVGAVLPILFLSGSYSPFGNYLPNPLNLLGNQGSLGNLLGIQGTPALPIGAAGVTGFATFSILQRVLTTAQAATYSRPSAKMDMSQMMKHVQNMMPNMMGASRAAAGPVNLPNDMTRSQYAILSKYQQGFGKPKDVAKSLSMDKKHVEKETDSLKASGYLTGKNKLTSKALEVLS